METRSGKTFTIEKSKLPKPKQSTLKKTTSDIVGCKRDLRRDVLPSNKDILRYYLWLERNSFKTIVQTTIEIWNCADIPTVHRSTVMKKLKKLHLKHRQLLKLKSKGIRRDVKFQVCDKFKIVLEKLFDISACKCKSQCKCTNNKLSQDRMAFLEDQRTVKHMKIKQIEDNKKLNFRNDVDDDDNQAEFSEEYDVDSDSGEDDDDGVRDPSYHVKDVASKNTVDKNYNTLNMKPVALVAERYGASSRLIAAVASATLEVVGLVTPDNPVNVVDRHKIERRRDKLRNDLISQPNKEFIALYFDGRKDWTMFMKKCSDGVYRKSYRKEEHVSLIGEPGGHYLGHISLQKGHGRATDITNAISTKITGDFDAMGCDGTILNTGENGGVIRLYEKNLKHAVQWLICQLHFNELPLRALFEKIDGPTSGPQSFTGNIGVMLSKSLNLPVVKFKPIHIKLPKLKYEMTTEALSTDQQYLYEMCEAISTGVVSPSLAHRNPGKPHNARWLTLANNILRIYIGTSKPSKDLIELANYILKVYAPTWFRIKFNPKCVNGPQNLFYAIQASRYLKKEYRDVVDASIQRNGYFAHPENILLAMIHDDLKKNREFAYARIQQARCRMSTSNVRKFEIPTINFKANSYCNLINWNAIYNCKKEKKIIEFTEPPVLKRFTELQLKELVKKGQNSTLWTFSAFGLPNHTQAVERCVKMVTETSKQITGETRRDGSIRAKICSRKLMPAFNTKHEYVTHM